MIIDVAKIQLWACIEDYAGLWELLWEVNSKFPKCLENERKRLSLDAVQLLLDRGLIKLYQCQEPFGDLSELDLQSAHSALNRESNWEAPEFRGISIRVGTTEKGKAMWQADTLDSIC